MLFSSTVFLFCFLPTVSLIYLCVKKSLRQYVLLLASLLFYAWGEPRYLAVMMLVCGVNYAAAVGVDAADRPGIRRMILGCAVAADIGILGYFKYMNFFVSNINNISGSHFPLLDIVMPIGISFFVFQSISYVIDVYRGDAIVQKNFARLTLYISFFPALIAGPIVKYHDIAPDLACNSSSLDDVIYGMRRFIVGLGKKVLIANPLGEVADTIFSNGFASADISIAWLGTIVYGLQLFFDFSGYSDMAIGLGRVFGFHILENFNYPYISKSIGEFWRRWHISLGTWFKEYVYIPLGGNRHGSGRTYLNLLLVFFVTGLWHGASWTFVIWGLWHGLFIVIERFCGVRKTENASSYVWIRHVYTLLVLFIGWPLFRADTITEGVGFIGTMFGLYQPETIPMTIGAYLSGKTVIVLAAAVLFSMPVGRRLFNEAVLLKHAVGRVVYDTSLLGVLILSIAALAASTYNPFIYFRF